jgi:hypothetical protein
MDQRAAQLRARDRILSDHAAGAGLEHEEDGLEIGTAAAAEKSGECRDLPVKTPGS